MDSTVDVPAPAMETASSIAGAADPESSMHASSRPPLSGASADPMLHILRARLAAAVTETIRLAEVLRLPLPAAEVVGCVEGYGRELRQAVTNG